MSLIFTGIGIIIIDGVNIIYGNDDHFILRSSFRNVSILNSDTYDTLNKRTL